MNDKYKIIAKYIKDMSSETPDIDTYLFVKDNLSNYSLNINIQSKALKEKIIQVETTLNYSDKNENNKKYTNNIFLEYIHGAEYLWLIFTRKYFRIS